MRRLAKYFRILLEWDARAREKAKWRYVEPGADFEPIEHVLTEAEILKFYYPWWSEQMKKVHKEHLINEQNCIEEFVVVHWASKVDE